jgi:hypothetical protein
VLRGWAQTLILCDSTQASNHQLSPEVADNDIIIMNSVSLLAAIVIMFIFIITFEEPDGKRDRNEESSNNLLSLGISKLV